MEDEISESYDFFFNLSINLFNSALYYLLGKFIWRVFHFLLIIPFLNISVDLIYVTILLVKKMIKLIKKIIKHIKKYKNSFFERRKLKKNYEKIKILNNLVVNEFKQWIVKEIIGKMDYKIKKSFFNFFGKKDRNTFLLNKLSKDDFDFFKIIESKGWYFYDPDDCNHRRRMFILLINYFTFVTNGSFTKFIKTKNYGIDFSGKKEEYKTYFFFHSSSIPSFDPVLSILYLLNHINVYNKGKIGDYQLKKFPFINQ